MDQDQEPQTTTTQKWRAAGRWSLGGLGLIGVLALTGLILTWSSHPDTVRFELAKTFMQVLAIAFFGTLATLAAFLFQRSHAQADQQAERQRQGRDNYRDLRRREDDQLRSIMNETLAAYNRVKQIRRQLRAETVTTYSRISQIRGIVSSEIQNGTDRCVSLRVYDQYMSHLIDEQLRFERLKRFTPFISDERLSPLPNTNAARFRKAMRSETLTSTYEDIEKYLNHVIHEYEDRRHTVVDRTMPMIRFHWLSRFIDTDFEPHVADKMDVIIETLLTALWQPLEATTKEHVRTSKRAPRLG
jgi:hypothetical protein